VRAFEPGSLGSTDLESLVQRALEPLATDALASAALAAAPAPVRESLPRVFACSDFLAQSCARDPQLFVSLLTGGDLERPLAEGELRARVAALPAQAAEPLAQQSLRRWRRRELARIAWRDLAGWADLA
jgi:[glutamine synthetase] adenylyltransferase / [glutamine synthetase]-adenylyl-L-tyrosine phosphorylase